MDTVTKELYERLQAEVSKHLADQEMLNRGLAMQALQQAKQQFPQSHPTGLGAALVGNATAGAVAMAEAPRQREWWEGKVGIKTDRLFLMELEPTQEFIQRVLGPDIIDQVVAWLNDYVLLRYSRNGRIAHDYNTQWAYWMKEFGGKNLLKSVPSKYWFICQCERERNKDDILIGTITGFVNNGVVDIGILLGAEQGHGYAAEAMNGVINYYNMRGVTTFTCGTDQRNEPMIKLALTMGMKEVHRDDVNVYFQMDIPSSKIEDGTVIPLSEKEILLCRAANISPVDYAIRKKARAEAPHIYGIDSSTWTGR